MRIYVPSYYSEKRKISPDLNRPETIFVIRPMHKDWYEQNFPNAIIRAVIKDDAPKGINGIISARQWILDDWRADTSADEFAWMIDDDWTGFTLNTFEIIERGIKKEKVIKNSKRSHPTIDEAYEFLLSKADKNTRIIGPTNSNSEMAFNPDIIRTNNGESAESCFLFSKKCVGNYKDNVFENQYLAALQVMDDANFKVVHALQLDYVNDYTISTIFSEDHVNLSLILCVNTMDGFPDIMEKIKGNQGTWKIKFREKIPRNFGFNLC